MKVEAFCALACVLWSNDGYVLDSRQGMAVEEKLDIFYFLIGVLQYRIVVDWF